MNSPWKNSSRERYKFRLIKQVAKWLKTWSCFTEVGGELPRTSLLSLLPAHPGCHPPPAWAECGCEEFYEDGDGFAGGASFCCSCWDQGIKHQCVVTWSSALCWFCAVPFGFVLLAEWAHTYIHHIYVYQGLKVVRKSPSNSCHLPVPNDEGWGPELSVDIATHPEFWLHQPKPPGCIDPNPGTLLRQHNRLIPCEGFTSSAPHQTHNCAFTRWWKKMKQLRAILTAAHFPTTLFCLLGAHDMKHWAAQQHRHPLLSLRPFPKTLHNVSQQRKTTLFLCLRGGWMNSWTAAA